jgi:hypothetical protein
VNLAGRDACAPRSKEKSPATNFVTYLSKGLRLSVWGAKSAKDAPRSVKVKPGSVKRGSRKCNFYNQTVKLVSRQVVALR